MRGEGSRRASEHRLNRASAQRAYLYSGDLPQGIYEGAMSACVRVFFLFVHGESLTSSKNVAERVDRIDTACCRTLAIYDTNENVACAAHSCLWRQHNLFVLGSPIGTTVCIVTCGEARKAPWQARVARR